jgi:hypothetical protein
VALPVWHVTVSRMTPSRSHTHCGTVPPSGTASTAVGNFKLKQLTGKSDCRTSRAASDFRTRWYASSRRAAMTQSDSGTAASEMNPGPASVPLDGSEPSKVEAERQLLAIAGQPNLQLEVVEQKSDSSSDRSETTRRTLFQTLITKTAPAQRRGSTSG